MSEHIQHIIRPEEDYEIDEQELTHMIQRMEGDCAIPGCEGDVPRFVRAYNCLRNKVARLERELDACHRASMAMNGTRGRRGI